MEDSLRQRLEALNRGPLPEGVAVGPAKKPRAVAEVTVVSRSRGRTVPVANEPWAVKSSVDYLQRGEVVANSYGEHLRIRLPLEELWQGGGRLVAARQQFLLQAATEAEQAVEPAVVMPGDFLSFIRALPDRSLVLDLETCGLAGSALFLIGVLRQFDGGPIVELLLARNYAEEPAVLESFWQLVRDHDVLVTFNGKTFDWPTVLDRSARYRFESARTQSFATHLDVLHHARRRWRRALGDCRLLTLERMVCRRSRSGDVAGSRIPAIYADYVRTGKAREMDAVLYHNALDLVTSFDLALRLAG